MAAALAFAAISSLFPSMPSLSGDPSIFNVTQGTSGYPRANYLSNGNIMGAYTAFPPGTGNQLLVVTTSTNNGETWEQTGSAGQRPVAESTLDNPFPFQRPDGKVLLAYRNHDINAKGEFTTYRITISISENLGADWAFFTDAVVVEATPALNGLWEPFLRTADDGTLQMYYSHELNANDQDNFMRISSNGGKDWGDAIPVSGQGKPSCRDGMVGVVEPSDGKLIAVFESLDKEHETGFKIYSVSSSNGGKKWENRQLIYDPGNDKNAGAPQIVRVGNTLAVSFMTDEDRVPYDQRTDADKARPWPTVTAAKLIVSNDGGATWGYKTTVFPLEAYWPGLLSLKNENALLLLSSSSGKLESQKVVFSS
ncbi:hypothetical protein ACMFMG_010118 [Clarireedia jacksonii]